jgi:hypothetical protein
MQSTRGEVAAEADHFGRVEAGRAIVPAAKQEVAYHACGRPPPRCYGILQWYSLRQANTTASCCLAETTCRDRGVKHRT